MPDAFSPPKAIRGSSLIVLSFTCTIPESNLFANSAPRSASWVCIAPLNPHVRLHVSKHGGRSDVAFQLSFQHDPRPFINATLHLLHENFCLMKIHQWAEVGIGITRIAGLELGNLGHELLEKFVVNATLDEDAVGTHANLSLMGEAAEYRSVDRIVQVGILQNNHGAVAAKFKYGFLQRPSGNSPDVPAHRFRTGKRNDSRNWVFHKCVADFSNVGHDNVQ